MKKGFFNNISKINLRSVIFRVSVVLKITVVVVVAVVVDIDGRFDRMSESHFQSYLNATFTKTMNLTQRTQKLSPQGHF